MQWGVLVYTPSPRQRPPAPPPPRQTPGQTTEAGGTHPTGILVVKCQLPPFQQSMVHSEQV